MKRLIIISLTMLLAASAYADYHYASLEGSNEYPYTSWETGADSIQNAIDASSPHDTVYIGAGEWYESVATGVYDSVAIIGMGTDNTFMYTDEYRVEVLEIDYDCSVERITFQHLNDWRCIRARTFAGVIINNCRFMNSSRGIMATGGVIEVVNCIFDSCRTAITFPFATGDILISNNLLLKSWGYEAIDLSAQSAIVQNNIIINSDVAITSIFSPVLGGDVIVRNNIIMYGDHGITVDAYLIYNNTITDINGGNSNTGFPDPRDIFFNNSFTRCNVGIGFGRDIKAYYNNFWENNVDFYNPWGYELDSIGNIYENPMYISDTDLHLQAYSPLIDAGHPDYFDVDSTRADIGAYGGPLGETYEYQDLAPAIPDSISGELNQDTIVINWQYNSEVDFNRYLIYKDTLSGFEPSVFNLIAEPDTSFYADSDLDQEHDYYYRIASVDNQDNISDYSEELEVLITDIWNQPGAALPQITSIKTNYPNPFNTSTTIIYSVANLGPVPAEIQINIYDITGRKVRTLVNEKKDLGEYTAVWNGQDDIGNECSTGVYFARISQWGLEISGKPRKLVLIK